MDNVIENFTPIATVFLMAAVGAYFIWRNNFKTRRANACATFRAAIDRELGSVSTVWPDDINAFLRSRYPALLSAAKEFYRYVPWWRKRGFDRAWLCFYNANPDGYDHQCYDHYIEILSNERPLPNVRAIFHNNVGYLLSYAKET